MRVKRKKNKYQVFLNIGINKIKSQNLNKSKENTA
jgi:hypothetical protein